MNDCLHFCQVHHLRVANCHPLAMATEVSNPCNVKSQHEANLPAAHSHGGNHHPQYFRNSSQPNGKVGERCVHCIRAPSKPSSTPQSNTYPTHRYI